MRTPHISSAHGGKSLARRIYLAKWLLIGIPLATLAFEHLGWLDPLEFASVDAWQRLLPSTQANHVSIVGITDLDYATMFGGHRPTENPGKLLGILRKIEQSEPDVIGVDLDTSAALYRDIASQLNDPRIVWARDAHSEGRSLVMDPVLGGAEDHLDVHSGLVPVPRDSDRVLRRYVRWFETPFGPRPSFHWSLIRRYCAVPANSGECSGLDLTGKEEGEMRLNVFRSREGLRPIPAGQTLPDFKGKIVLLGGTFRDSRDMHETPLGPMYGVEIIAHTIETEFTRKDAADESSHLVMFPLDILVGIILICVHYRFPFWTAILISLFAIIPLSLISYVAFATWGIWLSFIPMNAGIVIDQMIHHVRHTRNLERELAARDRAKT